MLSRVSICLLAVLSWSCDGQARSETPTEPIHKQSTVLENHSQEQLTASFEEVLAEYQSLNARLEQVAYRLQSSNVELCPRLRRDPGFTVHTATDYPKDIRPFARAILPVTDGLSIRSVRPGSSADKAGLETGDVILKLGGSGLPRGQTAAKFYRLNQAELLVDESLKVAVERDKSTVQSEISPETICRYPVNLFFSENVNGHTDGDEVWITSQLLRTVPDDVNLALVVAHEMAHAIADHVDLYPSKSLELLADRMALIMMARAGYDIDRAISYWANAVHPHGQGRDSQTHPSISERLAHFESVRDYIRHRQANDLPLDFEHN